MNTNHTFIPKGYQITVVSWENDADNYQTRVISGLNKNDAKFMVEFAKIFGNDDEDVGFGNVPEGNDEYYERLAREVTVIIERERITAPARLQQAIDQSNEGDPDDEYWYNKIADEAIEIYRKMFGNSDFEFRMYESHTVGYIENDIYIKDVTNEF